MIKEFDRVFNEDGPLRTMKGDLMRIHIKPDVKVIPLNVCTPRKTPIAYMEAAKAKIDSDLQLGIIEKVDGVSRWCSPMSFVPKPNGKVRSLVILRSWEETPDEETSQHRSEAATNRKDTKPTKGTMSVWLCLVDTEGRFLPNPLVVTESPGVTPPEPEGRIRSPLRNVA